MNMKIQGACKLLLLGVICMVFFLASVITASAQDCEFSLTDAQPNVGRLFRFSLECRSTNKIAAFVSEIEYDAQALKYRSVRKEAENAEYSINVMEEGKLRLVYLCEDGADNAPLFEFTFKAEQAGEFIISASFEQVIDVNGTEVPISSVESGLVTVDAPDKKPKTEKTESSEQYVNKTEPSAENKVIILEGREQRKVLIISVLIVIFVLICLVAVLLYKFGIKQREK